MPYDVRTRQYVEEENIIKDATGKETASTAKHKAVSKLTDAFNSLWTKEEEAKEEKEEKEAHYNNDVAANVTNKVNEAIADIEANGYKANPVKTDGYGNPIMGTETENQKLVRVLEQKRLQIESAIRLSSRNPQREQQLIDEYKHIDKELTRLKKAIRMSCRKEY